MTGKVRVLGKFSRGQRPGAWPNFSNNMRNLLLGKQNYQLGRSRSSTMHTAVMSSCCCMQALAKADKPPTLGGPSVSPAAFGGGDLKPGRLAGRLGPPAGFGAAPSPQPPGPFGQPSATAPKGFGNSVFGAPATPAQPSSAFGQGASQQPSAFGNQSASGFGTPAVVGQAPAFGQPSAVGSQPTSVFGSSSPNQASAFGPASANQAPAFGSQATHQAPAFGGAAANQAPAFGGQTASASAFGKGTFGNNQAVGASAGFGGGGTFGNQPQQPSPFGGVFIHIVLAAI